MQNGARPQPKQLVFDCRYGWVYEEWREPASIAHLGGRGMFSIVPLTVTTCTGTLSLANQAADVVAGILQDPPSLQSLHITLKRACVKAEEDLSNWFNKMKSHTSNVSLGGPRLPWLALNPSGLGRQSFATWSSRKGQSTYEYELVENTAGNVRPVF